MWILNLISDLLSWQSLTFLILLIVIQRLARIEKQLENISAFGRQKNEPPNDELLSNHKSENDTHPKAMKLDQQTPNPFVRNPSGHGIFQSAHAGLDKVLPKF
jgi:hypothetical protein